MDKVFLDTNTFIDFYSRNPSVRKQFDGKQVFISPLSIHVLAYVYKLQIPSDDLLQTVDFFTQIDLSTPIMQKSLQGPTNDLEDNIQLHSAVVSDCEYFVTRDKELLMMKFFGKLQIIRPGD